MKKYFCMLLLMIQSGIESSEKKKPKITNPFSPQSSPTTSPQTSPRSTYIPKRRGSEFEDLRQDFQQEFHSHPHWLSAKIRRTTLKPIVLKDHTDQFFTNIAYTTKDIPFFFILVTEDTPCRKYIVLIYDNKIPREETIKSYEFDSMLTATIWITKTIKSYEVENENNNSSCCTIS